MRVLLFVLFASTTIPTLAATRIASQHALFYVNDDGTVSLTDPYFSQAGGYLSSISSDSNMDGLCALFGFSSYIKSSGMRSTTTFNQTIVLDEKGHFKSYANSYRMVSLICDFETATMHWDLSEQNDDGSTTIRNPTIGNTYYTRRISINSNPLGVCQRLGFTDSDSVTQTSTGSPNPNVKLTSDGQLNGFDLANIISSITCR